MPQAPASQAVLPDPSEVVARPWIPGAIFVLLWPSCILALIALAPRAVDAPNLSTLLPLLLVLAVAFTPIALALRAVLKSEG